MLNALRCPNNKRGWKLHIRQHDKKSGQMLIKVMYNGHTGLPLPAQIFVCPTYYQRLKHMVCLSALIGGYIEEVMASQIWMSDSNVTRSVSNTLSER